MEPFDKSVYRYCKKNGAFYRRYSDDIAIVGKVEDKEKLLKMLRRNLKKMHLQPNPKKKNVIIFKRDRSNNLIGYSPRGEIAILQYLGFIFDGQKYLIRPSSMSRYYRKMKKSVKSAYRKAKHNRKNKKIFGKKIYEKFTHLGKRNFISYAYLASAKMQASNIRSQVKYHMQNVSVTIKKYKAKSNNPCRDPQSFKTGGECMPGT